jgi:BolA protein
MGMEEQIKQKLIASLEPEMLVVENESHNHSGHAGSPDTGESHFKVSIMSEQFVGKSRVERHRMVNEVLAEELDGKIHALRLRTCAPSDTEKC